MIKLLTTITKQQMNFSKCISITLLLLIPNLIYTQVAGNQVYNSHHNYGNSVSVQKSSVYTTDSTMVITTKILMNKVADYYLLTVGAHQEAKELNLCNQKINERIQKIIDGLEEIDIASEDIYIDFITQTKIYDYEITSNETKQYENGFEIKKNLIIRMKNLDKLDSIISLCASEKVDDIVNVEYINTNINEAYNEMFDEAMLLIESRKRKYLKVGSYAPTGVKRLVSDNFFSLYPKSQYKQYEAYESSNVSIHNRNYSHEYIAKEARKHKTFYYDGAPISGFDKVINPTMPEVGIQYVLTISMVYELS